MSAGSRLRVALVCPSLRAGGLEKMVADLALELLERGFEPGVFGLTGLGVYAASLEARGIALFDAKEQGRRLRGIPRPLIRQLRAFRPHVIHAHSGTWYPAAVARLALRSPRLVFTDHGRYLPEPAGRLLVERFLAAITDAVVAVTGSLAQYVRDSLGIEVRVIPNGIDMARYHAIDPAARGRLRDEWGVGDDEPLLIVVGRFFAVKNHAGVLRAFARLVTDYPRAKLVLVGSGPLLDEVRQQAAALALDERVLFTGFRADVPECLSAADIWINASFTEALPVAMLEAMAAGVPIVATAVGGVPETLGDPPAALLAPPGDIAALEAALRRLLDDPALGTANAARARALAQRYTLAAMADGYAALYRNVTQNQDAP